MRLDDRALHDVLAERTRQDAKWGEQNHDPFCYLTVLMEEVGEFAQAALHARFGGHAKNDMRKEAIHMAAVAFAIVELLDRGTWCWGRYPDPPEKTLPTIEEVSGCLGSFSVREQMNNLRGKPDPPEET